MPPAAILSSVSSVSGSRCSSSWLAGNALALAPSLRLDAQQEAPGHRMRELRRAAEAAVDARRTG